MKRILRKLGLSLVAVAGLSAQAMANNVQVAVEGSLLTIVGDALANSIVVNQAVTGDVVITGRNGTLINGLASVRFRRLALNAMDVRMEGGNDRVVLRGLQIANDLYVNLGPGNDVLSNTAPFTVGANAAIEAAEGNDSVQLAAIAVQQDLAIDGGTGTLTVAISNSIVGKGLHIVSDEANDSVRIEATEIAESVGIELKGGADTVTALDVAAFSFVVNTDAGADVISLENVSSQEDIGIFTGVQNDLVELLNVSSGKSLTVSVDDGSDLVSATAVFAVFDAVLEGGAGADTLE
ncbi:MAG: hypothetical protein EHM42_04280, partial [Planctomycetaceae bacterium]